MGALWALTLVAPTLFACTQTSTTRHPVGASSAGVVQAASATGRWAVVDAGARIGSVVRFAEGETWIYVVRNAAGQDVGLVDSLGRAWRRRVHGPDEELGAGTLSEGVRQILRAPTGSQLEPEAAP